MGGSDAGVGGRLPARNNDVYLNVVDALIRRLL